MVKLAGLKDAAHHNETVGTVRGFDSDSDRYMVELPDGTRIAVRSKNLRQVITSPRVVDLSSQPELNNRVAATATFDPELKRYRIEGLVGENRAIAIKPDNVILPRRTIVTIDGVVK